MEKNLPMKQHALKVAPEFWEDLENGKKTFEIRSSNDRDFCVGDTLHLREWDATMSTPAGEKWTKEIGYTGRELFKRVTYLLAGERWGLREGYVIMALG